MRYRNLLLLLVGLGLSAALAEVFFRLLLPAYSITQRSGPGQITLYVLGFVGIFWFCSAVARINPLAFALGYLRDWRRLLGGFAVMFLIAASAMVLIHLIMWLRGTAGLTPGKWDTLTAAVWQRTAIALLVVVVLAIAEEMIFRAFVLRYLRWNSSRVVTISAVVASAAIFSLLHVIALQSAVREPVYGPLLFGLFLLGLFLGTVYVSTGSLACSIGIHAGVLGFKVFQRRTELILYQPDWLFGIRTNGYDLRDGPGIWLALLVATTLFVIYRKWLHHYFWIETAVAEDDGSRRGLGFRLDGIAPDLPPSGAGNAVTRSL